MSSAAPAGPDPERTTQMRPYYEQDGITIYHGDCMEIGLWGDVLVTDPPYGVGYSSGRGGKFLGASVLGDADTELRDEALAMWGARPAIVFGSWKRRRPERTRHILTWDKGDHVGMGDLSFPWKPNTEEIYILGDGFSGHRGSSVLSVNAPSPNFTAEAARLHPTEKPLALMVALLAKCPPGKVCDPFMGSGPTLVAAKELHRVAIGVEIEERYCEIAAKRLSQGVLNLGVA
jgi:DNA modification methylase